MNEVTNDLKKKIVAKPKLFIIGMMNMSIIVSKNSSPHFGNIELEDWFWHNEGSILIDITPTWIHVKDIQIYWWTLLEVKQNMWFKFRHSKGVANGEFTNSKFNLVLTIDVERLL